LWQCSNILEPWENRLEPGRVPSVEPSGEKTTERRLKMNRTLRYGALALLLAGAMLATAPARANSIHDEGYFGGSWTSIGPSNYAEHRNGGRIGPLYSHRYRYYGPAPYAYYGGPAYYSPITTLTATVLRLSAGPASASQSASTNEGST
jgi:hypothetical protein